MPRTLPYCWADGVRAALQVVPRKAIATSPLLRPPLKWLTYLQRRNWIRIGRLATSCRMIRPDSSRQTPRISAPVASQCRPAERIRMRAGSPVVRARATPTATTEMTARSIPVQAPASSVCAFRRVLVITTLPPLRPPVTTMGRSARALASAIHLQPASSASSPARRVTPVMRAARSIVARSAIVVLRTWIPGAATRVVRPRSAGCGIAVALTPGAKRAWILPKQTAYVMRRRLVFARPI